MSSSTNASNRPAEAPKAGRILVTGAGGQLGFELRRILPLERCLFTDVQAGQVQGPDGSSLAIEALDITDAAAVRALFRRENIAAVINGAAYTAVDKAESEPELAMAINAEGAQYLAEAAEAAGARLLQISTDFVFGGGPEALAAERPMKEDEPIHPQSVYARTKAEGEQRVLQACSRAAVVRTAWLYSSHGNNFVKTMLRLGREREELGVVNDQHGTPTYARHLAQALLPFLEQPLAASDYGIYHFTNSGRTTWCGFAEAIMAEAGLDCRIKGIPTSAYPTPASRPNWSVLDGSRWQQRFGASDGAWPPSWDDALRECLPLLLQNQDHPRA
jgi:dTDP-4-dehydrorhamnose reductase